MTGVASYPLAFLAGLVSFISPCVLPLLPGYLSFISGLSVDDLGSEKSGHATRMLATTGLFVLGFSLVFVLLGSAFGVIGLFLKEYRVATQQVAGVFIIFMGLFMMGLLNVSALYKEVRFLPSGRKYGSLSALPMGMAFAVGWTPCIGPILGAIYMLAVNSPGRGASLLLVYSLGLGVPFVVSGLLFSRLTGTLDWFKRHSQIIHKSSGAVLVVIGILLFTGYWVRLISPLQRYINLPI